VPETDGDTMPDLMITHERIDALMPAARNARTHSKKQIRQIANGIDTFGFNNPVLCDGAGRIVAGHGRWAAAKLLGRQTIPVFHVHDLTPEQLRAYALAENKLSELGGWSLEIAALEFQELGVLDLGFDLTVTGFETGEIDLMLLGDASSVPDEPSIPEVIRSLPSTSAAGDVWQIGPHVVVCGNALTHDAYQHMPRPAEIVFGEQRPLCGTTIPS